MHAAIADKKGLGAQLGLTGTKLGDLHHMLFGPGNQIYVGGGLLKKGQYGARNLAHALALARPNAGDVILLPPGYSEDITTPFAINKAGVTIMGLPGSTSRYRNYHRPKLNITKDGAANDFTVDQPGVTLAHLDLVCVTDSASRLVDLYYADGLTLSDVEFRGANRQTTADICLRSVDVSLTGMSVDDGGTVITGSANDFPAWAVGKTFVATGGTNITAGNYTITAVSADGSEATLAVTPTDGGGASTDLAGSFSRADDVLIDNCRFLMPQDGTDDATHIMSLDGVHERWTIQNCYAQGDWSTGGIKNETLLCHDMRFLNNCIINHGTDNVIGGIEVVDGTTGVADGNLVFHGYTTAMACYSFGNSMLLGLNRETEDLTHYGAVHGTEASI
jgi:hypothetical protein